MHLSQSNAGTEYYIRDIFLIKEYFVEDIILALTKVFVNIQSLKYVKIPRQAKFEIELELETTMLNVEAAVGGLNDDIKIKVAPNNRQKEYN